MRLDGFGLFVNDMGKMIRFYRDVLGFEIKENKNTSNVYLVKDGTLFLLYGRKDFEEVDKAFQNAIARGATPVLEPTTEVWGQRTCYIADLEGNLIEIGSWNKPFESKDV